MKTQSFLFIKLALGITLFFSAPAAFSEKTSSLTACFDFLTSRLWWIRATGLPGTLIGANNRYIGYSDGRRTAEQKMRGASHRMEFSWTEESFDRVLHEGLFSPLVQYTSARTGQSLLQTSKKFDHFKSAPDEIKVAIFYVHVTYPQGFISPFISTTRWAGFAARYGPYPHPSNIRDLEYQKILIGNSVFFGVKGSHDEIKVNSFRSIKAMGHLAVFQAAMTGRPILEAIAHMSQYSLTQEFKTALLAWASEQGLKILDGNSEFQASLTFEKTTQFRSLFLNWWKRKSGVAIEDLEARTQPVADWLSQNQNLENLLSKEDFPHYTPSSIEWWKNTLSNIERNFGPTRQQSGWFFDSEVDFLINIPPEAIQEGILFDKNNRVLARKHP